MKASMLGFVLPALLLCFEESYTFPSVAKHEGNSQAIGRLSTNNKLECNLPNAAYQRTLKFWNWFLDRKNEKEDKDMTVDSTNKQVSSVDLSNGGIDQAKQAPRALNPDPKEHKDFTKGGVNHATQEQRDDFTRQESQLHEPNHPNKAVTEEEVVSDNFENVGDQESQHELGTDEKTKTETTAEPVTSNNNEDDRNYSELRANTDLIAEEHLFYDFEEEYSDSNNVGQTSHILEDDTSSKLSEKGVEGYDNDSHIMVELDDGTVITDEDFYYLENVFDSSSSGTKESDNISKSWSQSSQTISSYDEKHLFEQGLDGKKSNSYESALSDEESEYLKTVLPHLETDTNVNNFHSKEFDSVETVLPSEEIKPSGGKTDSGAGQRRHGCNMKSYVLDMSNLSKILGKDESNDRYGDENKLKGIIIMFWKFIFKTILRCLGL